MRVVFAALAALGLIIAVMLAAAHPGWAEDRASGLLLLEIESLNAPPPSGPMTDPGSGMLAKAALGQGRWPEACSIATRVLARQVPDLDALGVFALCAAVQDDRMAAEIAMRRLASVEPVRYYGALAEAVLRLQEGKAAAALADADTVLARWAGDPLALYVRGEALHALDRDDEAIAAFRGVATKWPEHAPALTAAARLILAAPEVSSAELADAVAMAEHVARRDPWQRRNWQLLADLCRRAGQEDRAQAITLQWLRPVMAR